MELRSLRDPRSSRRIPHWPAPRDQPPLAPRLEPAVLIRAQHLLGRIRGIPIGAPGFEPGTSATRTQRSTGLSHAPRSTWIRAVRAARPFPPARSTRPTACAPLRGSRVGSNLRTLLLTQNGRGGIRTHAGVSPHDFQSCALSHSATRPATLGTSPRDVHASRWIRLFSLLGSVSQGVGWARFARRVTGLSAWRASARITALARSTRTTLCDLLCRSPWVRIRRPARPSSSGGSGIRTHADLSVQRLSRAPP